MATLEENGTVLGTEPRWHRSLESLVTVEARDHWAFRESDPHVEGRVAEWVAFWLSTGQFPPGAITKDGMLVDGHHRIRAARRVGALLPCVVAVPIERGWALTGAVRFAR